MAVCRLCTSAHRAPRYINISGFLQGPFLAIRGGIAGRSVVTSSVRGYNMQAFVSVQLKPRTSLDLHIDDLGLSAQGSFQEVFDAIAHGAGEVFKAVESDI
eukprot:3887340-Pyramimonas_sp.AAC.1